MRARPVVLWDFDGTLGRRRSGMWGACLLELLDRDLPGHGVTRETLSPHLHNGFPWHDHHLEHHHLNEPATWWQHLNAILSRALHTAGVPSEQAGHIVESGFRDLYINAESWELYPDAVPALEAVLDAGGRNVIVSNHIPELADLIEHLGAAKLLDSVLTSARVGVEKPHPAIFRAALAAAGSPDLAWMAGDNPVADIAGARRLGLPGVLVRAPQFTADYVDRINRSYAGQEWLDWADHCNHRAQNALEAARLIIAETHG